MSYTEYATGKIIEIKPIENQTLEDLCKIEFLKYDIEFDDEFYETYEDNLQDEQGDKYLIVGDRLFKYLENHSVDIDSADISNVKINDDNTIDFEVMFYNGGGSLDDVIEYALKKNNLL